jgi:hypothetical protein
MLSAPKWFMCFPPGWTLHSGGPHIGLPLLRSTAQATGAEVRLRDLNIESAKELCPKCPVDSVLEACRVGTMAEYNDVHFAAQDLLDDVARPFGASWDARLGFTYDDLSPFSSAETIEGAKRESPFTAFYARRVVPEISSWRPDIIGLGIACIQQMVPALQLARMIRQAGCEALIIAGGNTISRLADSLAVPRLFDFIDGFALYQGEPVVKALTACAKSNRRSLAGVPDLIWNDGGCIRRNFGPDGIDPDACDPPEFDGLPLQDYWGEPYLPLLSSRGCYHGLCSFCAIPLGWGPRGFAGMRDPELVYADLIGCVEKYGIRNFKFVDEAMPPRTLRLLATRLAEDGVRVQWEAYTRLEHAWTNTDLAEVAAEGGFCKGYFGVEILDGGSRAVLNKRDSGDALGVFRRCRSAGILVHMFSMLGYPGTTAVDAQRTIEFALSNSELIDTVDIFAYGCARGTTQPKGITVRKDPRLDWAMEFPFESTDLGVLSSSQVDAMVEFYEELVFSRCPRLLHPTYRLVSPWRQERLAQRLGAETSCRAN